MKYSKGHSYELVKSNKTFAAATADAKARGGHLAIIESAAEDKFIFDMVKKASNLKNSTAEDGGGARYVWLGGTDAKKEGTWLWSNGKDIDDGYSHWGSGPFGQEPDDYHMSPSSPGQDGLAMGFTNWPYPSGGIGEPGEWNDIDVNNKIYYVVEYDFLKGTSGNDKLNGTSGADRLYGEAGNDKLYGGLGGDDLTGGKGKDTFIYKSTAESKNTSAGRDTIFDFSGSGGDRIDLSDIDANTTKGGDQHFKFIGTKAYSGKAGELRYEKKASDTYIYADTNGDKKSDFAIHLDDAVTLKDTYFILV